MNAATLPARSLLSAALVLQGCAHFRATKRRAHEAPRPSVLPLPKMLSMSWIGEAAASQTGIAWDEGLLWGSHSDLGLA